jgi:hypothetical protein
MSTIDTSTGARVLRPKPSVPRTVALSGLALITPVFAVLYLLTVPGGTWPAVLAVHVLLSLGCAAVSLGLHRARLSVSTTGVELRDPLGRRRWIDRDAIRQLLLVHTYRGQTLDTQHQLFVVTWDERAALRLSGWMWSRDSMRQLARELDVPITAVDEAMTPGELRRTHPHLLHWLERRWIARVIAIAAVVVLGLLAAAALLSALGLPGCVHL